MSGRHSIRIPVHGFVELDDWEWDIVNHPVFQRLRRVRQLAFSEHIYPGSTHTRFEHSLGVMHVATKMFDVLRAKHESQLTSAYGFDQPLWVRCRSLVRLAALLHDVGHAPLSHSGEDLMPEQGGKRLDHEDYSYWLIREQMRDVIDDHPMNRERLHVTGEEIASFYLGRANVSVNLLLWRELVAGQLDADRMDYLLRDSHHCGVTYGQYDLHRVLDTLVFVEDDRDDSTNGLRIGIEDGGRHAAEGLILARYFMFEQVYFQKTRLAYDHHAAACLASSLKKGGTLPDPTIESGRKRYLELDDWYLMDHVRRHRDDRHSIAILQHRHDREVFRTSEVARSQELARHDELLSRLRGAGIDAWSADASKSWYKTGRAEILIASRPATSLGFRRAKPLTEVSETAGKVRDSAQRRIFVPLVERERAKALVATTGDGHGTT